MVYIYYDILRDYYTKVCVFYLDYYIFYIVCGQWSTSIHSKKMMWNFTVFFPAARLPTNSRNYLRWDRNPN